MPLEYTFLKPRPIFARLDIIPFLLLFAVLFHPTYNLIEENWIIEEPDNPSNSTFRFLFDHVNVKNLEPHVITVLAPAILVIIEVVFVCASYWYHSLDVFFHYSKVSEENATHVAFRPDPHKGIPGIVRYNRGAVNYAIFQQKKREYKDGKFQSLKYPNKRPLQEYLNAGGLSTQEAEKRTIYYGENSYKLPVPTATQLLVQNLKSPFLLFQIFTFFVMILDEYWTQPLMGSLQLIFFEYSNIKLAASNYNELRGADLVPTAIWTLRDKKWKKVISDKLLPGDVILVQSDISAPCDLVLLNGRVVVNEAMLTGESTPQLKDSIDGLPSNLVLDTEKHRRHIIFGGTQIEQIIPATGRNLPEEGALCYVIATGLASAQGKLLRTIIFGSDHDQTKYKDSFKLFFVLTICAFYTSIYYFFQSLEKKDEESSIFRTILTTLQTFTFAIPPDLPNQLSLQVNTSVNGLSKLQVYTTEPFRVQFAGEITACCFDKTGTLTSEDYKLVGVDNLSAPPAPKNRTVEGNYFTQPSQMPRDAMTVIGGCHALVRGKNNKLIGDSLEAAAFSQMHFKLNPDKSAQYEDLTITPIKEYHFTSELKRMSVVCNVSGYDNPVALIKGAPEVVQPLLKNAPADYKQTYMKYTRQGCRVLVLALRELDNSYNPQTAKREDIEHDFTFAGFAIFDAPLKRGSEDTVVALLQSNHRVIIITGDAALTAAHVARRLHMHRKPLAIYEVNGGKIEIVDEMGEKISSDEGRDIVYTGPVLEMLSPEELAKAINRCNVFARTSPQQKSQIIVTLNNLGHVTMMCGDGTNDVGAIKHAHVGVGLINDADNVQKNKDKKKKEEEEKKKKDEAENNKNTPMSNMPNFDLVEGFRTGLGAASVAAPFVSKRGTVTACIDIIRFGRATLTSTTDLFKQIAIRCILSSYRTTILNLENVRTSDRLLTAADIVFSIIMMSTAWARPMRTLSIERPIKGQFNAYLLVSVAVQAIVHLLVLKLTHMAVFAAGYKPDIYNYRSKFEPTLLNTAIFLVRNTMDAMTTICNYRGYPFMQPFGENKMLIFGFIALVSMNLVFMFNLIPFANKYFGLVKFPNHTIQFQLIALCFGDIIIGLFAERLLVWYFTRRISKQMEGLVDKETIESLDDYLPNEDDLMPSSFYNFGFKEMIGSMLENQVKASEQAKNQNIRRMKKKQYETNLEQELKQTK